MKIFLLILLALYHLVHVHVDGWRLPEFYIFEPSNTLNKMIIFREALKRDNPWFNDWDENNFSSCQWIGVQCINGQVYEL
jgi:hypothetical protein